MLALHRDELHRAYEANLLGEPVTLASRRLSGQPVVPVDNEDNEEVANAADAARRIADAALITSALKNCNGFGDQDLQDYVLQLLIKMTSKNHPTLFISVNPRTLNCGRCVLMIIKTFIMPKNAHTAEELTRAYNELKDKFRKSYDVYAVSETLLQAYYVKMHIARHFDQAATQSSKLCMNTCIHIQMYADTGGQGHDVIFSDSGHG
jgi:hypothetical protein